MKAGAEPEACNMQTPVGPQDPCPHSPSRPARSPAAHSQPQCGSSKRRMARPELRSLSPRGALRRPSLSAARTMPLHSPTEGTSRVRPRGCDRPTNLRGERTAKPTGETTVPASSAATGPSVGRPCRLSYSYLETNASCWLELPIRHWKLKNKREANVRLLQPAGRAL